MILPEALKKLFELQMKLKSNGGAKIDDIATVQDSSYGYVVVLTSFKGNIYDEVLSAKLNEMKGRQLNPDLWVFGPYMREETPQATHPALTQEVVQPKAVQPSLVSIQTQPSPSKQ